MEIILTEACLAAKDSLLGNFNQICDILKIEPPEFEVGCAVYRGIFDLRFDAFIECSSEDASISYLFINYKASKNLLHSLAHELRHLYQHKYWPIDSRENDIDAFRKLNYKEWLEYYYSPHELDANIFASNYMLFAKGLLNFEILTKGI